MLVVTIEMWPQGDQAKARRLGVAEIFNKGTGTLTRGNYALRIFRRGTLRRIWRCGDVEDFPRTKLGPWDLLYRALVSAVGKRSPDESFPLASVDGEDGQGTSGEGQEGFGEGSRDMEAAGREEERELLDRWTKEFEQLEGNGPVTFTASPLELWLVCVQVQLASRHPLNTGLSRTVAEGWARRVFGWLAPAGSAMEEMAERGWDPGKDVAVSRT